MAYINSATTESNIKEETMFNNNSFGERLKELRKSKKLTQVQVSELKGFNKTELDDLKFAIVINGIKSHSTLPKYLDELVSENNLDEEEQEILHTLFKEVYDYFNAD